MEIFFLKENNKISNAIPLILSEAANSQNHCEDQLPKASFHEYPQLLYPSLLCFHFHQPRKKRGAQLLMFPRQD